MKIPAIFQSSVDPEQVSLTVQSIGKAGAYFITFLGVTGLIDPSLTAVAAPAWAGFVASVITAIPAGFTVYHMGQAVIGVVRKIAVRLVAMFSKAPAPAQQ